ncbi:phospholipase-like protein [Tanacetum coccineum]|uniref:Phospholipase-like protein n=1 Tax=Tanacetum coccineum TaxID=301880 RepID=A0ABQ5F6M8_9ASTR
MTIAEYMEYEARMKRQNVHPTKCEDMDFNCLCSKSVAMEYPYYSDNAKIDLYYALPPCFQPTQTHTNYGHEYTYKDFGEDMGSIEECELEQTDRTVNEWFKTEIEKYRRMQQKKNQECAKTKALIQKAFARTNKLQGVSFVADDDVLEGDIPSKFLPCQLPPKELNPGSFTLSCTIGSLNLYAMADLGASVNVMPKSMLEHLKLTNLKETDMLVEMDDMTRKAPLGIVENILVKINKFLFPSDFVTIDMLGKPSETMILGRPFLATIHAQIDVFNREILLGIGEDRVLFDMDGGMYHSKIHVEKVYTANSIQEEESFNLLEIGDDLFSYESPTCLLFEQCTRFCDDERIDTIDSSDNIGYNVIYGKREHGMLEQWMCFRDNERQSVGGNRMIFADFLKVRYGNKNIDDTPRKRRYYKWVAQNSEFGDNDISHETTMYDNPCKYRHEYPRTYFPHKDKGMPKPWDPLFNEGYTKNKTPRDQESTSRNLTPKEITDQFHQEDQILNIKTYFSDFPQLQPSKLQPRDYSYEEWLRIKLGHTNVSKSVRNPVLNKWVLDSFDVEIDYGKTRDDPYSRMFDEYKKVFDKEIEQLANEYDLRIGKKGYALDDVWERCKKLHGITLYPWHDKGFKEEER